MKHVTLVQTWFKIARYFLQDLIVIIAIIAAQVNTAVAQQTVLPAGDQPPLQKQNSPSAPTAPAQSQQSAPIQASAMIMIPAGTKLPLGLVRPISVTKSKPGDSVYLQITFPITAGTQMLVPPGTYLQGVIGKILKRERTRALLSFQLSSASLIFSTGYTVTFAGAVDTLPTTAEQRTPDLPNTKSGPPMAMSAAGTTTPPTLPMPSLGNGPRNASIALGVIAAAFTTVMIIAVHHHDIQMEAGTPLEIVLPVPLELDRQQVMAAVQQYSVQASSTPPAIVQPSKKPKMCYDLGTPGTPDTVIPGTPGTPDTVIPGVNGAPDTVIPGIPATPDSVIPGTPGTPGREYPCN
ncbi:MAG TPA: hypothetical protein VFW31_08460 [Candidatus Angelobacter sp.]|nr:hypothetical protein [Candidatus Angelobacter sp.]